MKATKFARKPFVVEAVQVTEENIFEVAEWASGEVRETKPKNNSTTPGASYIKVRVLMPRNERQTMAFVGDWVLYASTGFKVYTNKAFRGTFDPVENDYDKIYTDPKDAELKLFQESVSGSHPIVSI